MAKRLIRTGIGTYLRPDGIWHFGQHGEEVDVHDSDAERFDRLNGAAEPEPVEDVDGSDGEGVDSERPKQVAPKDEWIAYAVSQGVSQDEAEASTKDQLIERFKG